MEFGLTIRLHGALIMFVITSNKYASLVIYSHDLKQKYSDYFEDMYLFHMRMLKILKSDT